MILVFGTSGQLATELADLPDVLCLGRAGADLSDPAACAAAIRAHAPAAAINAAAYTAVDRAEEEEALVEAALRVGYRHIATAQGYNNEAGVTRGMGPPV